MRVKKYSELRYDSFVKGSQTLVWIDSNTSIILNSTGFGTLYLDLDIVHRIHVMVDGQSEIEYLSS
jgi:hypothetical protein